MIRTTPRRAAPGKLFAVALMMDTGGRPGKTVG
jgi:hypothetical protein